MSGEHAEPAESPEVVVRCQKDPSVVIRLVDQRFPDQYGVAFSVIAKADGLNARVDGGEVWVWDDDLARFLQGLADDFRGWDGERVWSVNHLALRAVFHSRGHVSLTWTLRPWISRDTWEASITTWQEAGEQMATLAADVRDFLLHRSGGHD
ncbi:DUF6228 family protein [Amycolatopsis sp. GM8]|uniref:DUF6228 family protein n=1 Tax=Amycolatopsis sp. GM8 TaxID=2896530 RepID=UPI001F20358A|nr:DUF6228 family protein [Amycolatopsis sp. GM8]